MRAKNRDDPFLNSDLTSVELWSVIWHEHNDWKDKSAWQVLKRQVINVMRILKFVLKNWL